MDIYECVVYLNGMRRKERAELERTRLIMWAALTPYSKKELELDDVLKLEHLQEDTETNHINDAEELRGLRERAKRMEEIMNE